MERLSGQTARVVWTPLTPVQVKGTLILLEIDYYVKQNGDSSCTLFESEQMDSSLKIVHIEGKIFELTAANITGLIPNLVYCVALQVSTGAGDSGYSNFLELPRKLLFKSLLLSNHYEGDTYSRTQLNGYPSMVDTCNKQAFQSPERIYSHRLLYTEFKPPELQTLRYNGEYSLHGLSLSGLYNRGVPLYSY